MNVIGFILACVFLFMAIVTGSVAVVLTFAAVVVVTLAIGVVFIIPSFFAFVGAYLLGDLK